MTYWHFLNCSALTFAPLFIIYKSSKLSEYRAYKICVYAALAYVATQLLKLIIAATFLPGSDSTSFDLVHELLRSLLGVVDVIGVHFTLLYIQASFDTKLLGIALGWGAAETFLLKIAPLWIGARGLEFDWKYTQESIESNISLLRYVGFVTAVWLYRRKVNINLNPDVKATAQNYQRVAVLVLLAYVVLPSVLSYLQLAAHILFKSNYLNFLLLYEHVDVWSLLGVQFILSALLYLVVTKTSNAWEKNIII